jgi:diguanylate cyclase (GGDEF)-like protein
VETRTTGTEEGNGSAMTSSAGKVAREVSALQAALLAKLRDEMAGADSEPFADAAQRLATEFGSVAATAVDAVCEQPSPVVEGHASLFQPGHMRRRLDQLIETNKRYGHPFGLVVFDVDGPDARNGEGGGGLETTLAVVGAALRDSVRLVDETFRLEEDAFCVLAPNQTTIEGVQMAERLLRVLDELEEAGGLRIGITAGVVACPEHGDDADGLLRKADEAMWRARAVSQPVGVGTLPDR